MSLRVLVTDGMDAGAVAQLRADGFEIVEKFYEPDELGTALKDFDAVIIRSATKIKKQQIDDAKGGNLKLIIRAGVGMDNIDIPYAEAAGIQVKNTPRSSSNAVAELAIALLFSCARFISAAGYSARQQKWEKNAYSKGFEVTGKTMGVIGYGRIGQMVARIIACKVQSGVKSYYITLCGNLFKRYKTFFAGSLAGWIIKQQADTLACRPGCYARAYLANTHNTHYKPVKRE